MGFVPHSFALSGLEMNRAFKPRAMPWAVLFRPPLGLRKSRDTPQAHGLMEKELPLPRKADKGKVKNGEPTAGADDDDPALDRQAFANGQLGLRFQPIA